MEENTIENNDLDIDLENEEEEIVEELDEKDKEIIKLREIVKRKNQKLKELEPLPEQREQPDLGTLESKIELKLEMKAEGYPQEAIDFALANGGRKALDNPIVKKALDEYKKQAQAEKAAEIDSSGQSQTIKKLTPQDIENMSAEELRAQILKD